MMTRQSHGNHTSQDSRHRTADTGHQTQDIRHRTSDTGHQTQDIRHRTYSTYAHQHTHQQQWCGEVQNQGDSTNPNVQFLVNNNHYVKCNNNTRTDIYTCTSILQNDIMPLIYIMHTNGLYYIHVHVVSIHHVYMWFVYMWSVYMMYTCGLYT